MTIESLTKLELTTIETALKRLRDASSEGSTNHWAAGVMLENDGDFLNRLMLRSAA